MFLNRNHLIGLALTFVSCSMTHGQMEVVVSNSAEFETACARATEGQTIRVADGTYSDLKLTVRRSGTRSKPIRVEAKNPGKVFISGDSFVEIRGDHVHLKGFYFRDGNRNPDKWRSHGPGLITIYSSHVRITGCAFHEYDSAAGGWITVTPPKSGVVPKFVRIDHCSFTHKPSFDQVINFNNCDRRQWAKKYRKIDGAEGAPAMFHRIDHCYFSNPKKTGNAGAGIRIGTWRNDIGSCLVDSNLFERQDSEAEIITSKSQGNVFYNNTFLNCQGTMNFRHGDRQSLVKNWFLGNDERFEYGGIFLWGSHHNVVANYVRLIRTRKSRGSAGLYLNSGIRGSEHARADENLIAHNYFVIEKGSIADLAALLPRRLKWSRQRTKKIVPTEILPSKNRFVGNTMFLLGSMFPVFKAEHKSCIDRQTWSGNRLYIHQSNKSLGEVEQEGIETVRFQSPPTKGFELKDVARKISDWNSKVGLNGGPYPIEIGSLLENKIRRANESAEMDLSNFPDKVKPLRFSDVGPSWLKKNPSSYAKSGHRSKRLKQLLTESHNQRGRKISK